MEKRNDAVFILTHGRADNVKTYNSLRKSGYKGKIYLIIDDEDSQAEEYKKRYGDDVIVFSKAEAAEYTDVADTQTARNVVVFARNTCHKIAKELGLTHFCEVDDDYSTYRFRYERDNGLHGDVSVTDMDKLFDYMYDFLDVSGAVAVCPAQGGDYIGGIGSGVWKNRILRKAMNMFFCRTDRPFKFYGRLNEDTTAYTVLGQRGVLFFTVANWCLNQQQTQANKGGLTDSYLENGTYVKSFYSVMYSPSCVKIAIIGGGGGGFNHWRIHHRVNWGKCAPKIISEKWKKK